MISENHISVHNYNIRHKISNYQRINKTNIFLNSSFPLQHSLRTQTGCIPDDFTIKSKFYKK